MGLLLSDARTDPTQDEGQAIDSTSQVFDGTKLSNTPARPTTPTAIGDRAARTFAAPDARSAGSATATAATGQT